MFNQKEGDNAQPAQNRPAPGSAPGPARRGESPARLLSVTGEYARLEGTFDIADSLEVECDIGGELNVGGQLVIGESGTVHADVTTVDAVIKGAYEGNMVATGNVEIVEIEIVEDAELVDSTLAGRRVVAALYGHPGVFAQVGHAAIAEVRAKGATAWMEPGVSAEACLYADLGLDPGDSGVQSFEATQFLVQRRNLDTASLVLLWQVALAGNVDCTGFAPDRRRLAVLVEKLLRWYPGNTEVILYEAASLPVQDFRADPIRLDELPDAALTTATTLIIPPATNASPDRETRDRLASIR